MDALHPVGLRMTSVDVLCLVVRVSEGSVGVFVCCGRENRWLLGVLSAFLPNYLISLRAINLWHDTPCHTMRAHARSSLGKS